jgi:hypothetical protein
MDEVFAAGHLEKKNQLCNPWLIFLSSLKVTEVSGLFANY